MAVSVSIEQKVMMSTYRVHSITAYNRLECFPRTKDFSRSIRAEVRDPLWMLTRQWQFGEFKGEDAASPVSAMIMGEHTPMDRLRFPDNSVQQYSEDLPLECMIESEKIDNHLYLAIDIARYFVKLINSKSLNSSYIALLIAGYSLNYSINPNDLDALQLNVQVNAQLFDGCKLIQDINTADGGSTKFNTWLTTQPGIAPGDYPILNKLADKLTAWYNRNYMQSQEIINRKDWNPSTLDYGFELASTPSNSGQMLLKADHFPGGHLDWYSFDLGSTQGISLEKEPVNPKTTSTVISSFIPAPVSFKGMPNPRFWTMEDSRTDFGQIDTTTTGTLHLLVAEFGLIYGNDWFMLPYPLGINNLCKIRGLVIHDVFGDNTLIDPAGAGNDNSWQRWAMFQQAGLNGLNNLGQLFYLAPAITHTLEGDPYEEVNFLRDEMANMVWAVETTVPSQTGKGASGNQMALQKHSSQPFTPAGSALIRYILGTTVPDNWTPFIPVHQENNNIEIRLQRAKMAGANGALGKIITETPAPYYINEEEVPRSGILVQRTFKSTRWLNGKRTVWLGRKKETGKGEGWSNLKFDQIVDIAPLAAQTGKVDNTTPNV